VLADFGQGGVFVGQSAVNAGLADAVGTYESTFAALRDGRGRRRRLARRPKSRAPAGSGGARADAPAVPAAVAPSTSEIPMKNAEQGTAAAANAGASVTTVETTGQATTTTAATPPATGSTVVTSIDEAAVRKTERERIAQIRTLGKGVDAKLVDKAIDDGLSADAAARLFLEAQQQQGAARLEQLRGDESASAAPAASGSDSANALSPRQAGKAAAAQYYAHGASRSTTTTK
jgi:hypothetical protein